MIAELLQPIEKRTLTSVVTERLIDYIRDAELKPGDTLPSQHELARQLGVSRPVLREAMQGLATVGIVEIRPGSGCYVRDPHIETDPSHLFEIVTHESAIEVLEARMVIEVELARLAALRATVEDFRRMEAVLEKIKRTVARGLPTNAATLDFHNALARAGHNQVLQRMSLLLDRARAAQGERVESTLPDIGAGEYASHYELFLAIRSGDPAVASAAMTLHLEKAHGWEDRIMRLRQGLPG